VKQYSNSYVLKANQTLEIQILLVYSYFVWIVNDARLHWMEITEQLQLCFAVLWFHVLQLTIHSNNNNNNTLLGFQKIDLASFSNDSSNLTNYSL